jgi:hypothetical protein
LIELAGYGNDQYSYKEARKHVAEKSKEDSHLLPK